MFGRQNTKVVSLQPDTVAGGGAGFRSTLPVGRPFRVIGVALTCDSPGATVYARFGWTTAANGDISDAQAGQKITSSIGANSNGMGPDYVPIVQGFVSVGQLYYYVEEPNARLFVEVQNQKAGPVNVGCIMLIDDDPIIPPENRLNAAPQRTPIGPPGGSGFSPISGQINATEIPTDRTGGSVT